jgi:hypothetical protein
MENSPESRPLRSACLNLLCRSDGHFRLGFADRRQVNLSLAIVVGSGGSDKAADGRNHRNRRNTSGKREVLA